jgi:Fuc2NAc and GlcNAc transferase
LSFLEICIFSAVFLATYFGVRWYRAWSLKRGVLDHPNERSSHSSPTPRGGGLVMAIVIMAVYLGAASLIGYEVSIGFAVAAALVAAVSLLDDLYSISFAWRLLVHSISAALVIYSCGHVGLTDSAQMSFASVSDWIGAAMTFVWIVWTLNAYNFMDGIDGIAGLQAVTASIGWMIIGLYMGEPAILMLGGSILFASLAFLLHNWPPARIFMGDAGSAFLGFCFASMPFVARTFVEVGANRLFIAGIALLWLFIFDSIFTLIRRAARREKVWNAHREHLYQRLIRSGYAHRTVTLIYGGLSAVAAVAAVFSLLSDDRSRIAILIAALFCTALSVVALCWKRRCLFGRVT